MNAEEKEEIAGVMIIIMRAIKEVMRGGGEQTLHFGDAEINIKKTKPDDLENDEEDKLATAVASEDTGYV